jgi:hypothetical protein
MKTKLEIYKELDKLKEIVNHAHGIYREDCPELLTKIQALEWVLGIKDVVGKSIRLDIMEL